MSLLTLLGSAPAFTPASLPNLALWLDARNITGLADGAAVATWPDASGNGRDAAQATGADQPAYAAAGGANAINGQPAVYWSGTTTKKLLTPSFLGAGYNSGFTFIAVTSCDSVGGTRVNASNGGLPWFSGRAAGGTNSQNVLHNTNALTPSQFANGLASKPIVKAVVETFRWDGTTKTQRLSGWQRASVAATGTLGLTGALAIGNFPTGSFAWVGATAAYLVYNRALSDAECLQVEKYLAKEWEIDHLPQVVCHGNSLTSGTGSTAGNDYPSVLLSLLGGATVAATINAGTGSQTTAQMVANAALQVDARLSGTTGGNTLVFWEGTNSLYFGATAAATIADYQTYLAARNTAGWTRMVVPTLQPRSDTSTPGTFEADRQTVNAWIRANAATYGYVVADVAADSRIGDAGDELNTTYYLADKVHMTNAGYAIVAGIIKAAIDTLT